MDINYVQSTLYNALNQLVATAGPHFLALLPSIMPYIIGAVAIDFGLSWFTKLFNDRHVADHTVYGSGYYDSLYGNCDIDWVVFDDD